MTESIVAMAGAIAANSADRIAIHAQDVKLTTVAGETILLCKKNDKGFAGCVARVPSISAQVVADFAATADDVAKSRIYGIVASALTQAQRDILRNSFMLGAGSVERDAVSIAGALEFLANTGAAGWRFTKDVLDSIAPIVGAAAFAYWCEVKGDAVNSLSEEEKLAASKTFVTRIAGMLETLFISRNKDDAAKASFDEKNGAHLQKVFAMALDLGEEQENLQNVLQLIDAAVLRGTQDIL